MVIINVLLFFHALNAAEAVKDKCYATSKMVIQQEGLAEVGKVNCGSQVILRQVGALNQFTCEGSSAASCGMHALRNGLLLAAAAVSGRKELLNDINSAESMKVTFNDWRLKLCKKQVQEKICTHLRPLLWCYYKGPAEFYRNNKNQSIFKEWSEEKFLTEITDRVSSVIGSVCTDKALCIETENTYTYTVTADVVYERYSFYMKQNAVNNASPIKELQLLLSSREAFDQLFTSIKETALVFSLQKDASCMVFVDNEFKETIKRGSDWLAENEIMYLLEGEQREGMLKGLQVKFLLYACVLDESDTLALEQVRTDIQANNDMPSVILISTSELPVLSKLFGTMPQGLKANHWFTLFVNNFERSREYVVVDSTSCSRLYDTRVRMLLDYCEGKRAVLEEPHQIPFLLIGLIGGGVIYVLFLRKKKNKDTTETRAKKYADRMSELDLSKKIARA